MPTNSNKPIQLSDEERDDLRDAIRSDITNAEGEVAERKRILDEHRDFFNITTKRDKLYPDAPEITIPYVKTTVLALEAKIYPTLLKVTPIMNINQPKDKTGRVGDLW